MIRDLDVERAGDHENAAQFLDRHREDVRYIPETKTWLRWNESWWAEDATGEVLELARQTIDALRGWVGQAGDEIEFKRRARHYEWSSSAARRESLLAVASTQPGIPVTIDALDRPRHLLACRNGTVDLRSGKLRLADRGDLLTRGVELVFDPDVTSPEWMSFLDRIFAGDTDLVTYVQTLLGYAATGEVREHVLPIFHGTGANGKSTLVGAVQSVLGAHAVTAAEGLLVESPSREHPERLAELRGRRLVVSSELESRAVLAEGLVKAITGGDRVSARFMYGRRFDFQPTHTVILTTNHMPRVRGTDEAIWRRLRMVPFAVTIPPEDRVPDFGEQLATRHGQAILSWLVAGATAYYDGGLADPPAVVKATSAYRQREDVFGQWLDEQTVEISGRSRLSELREAWIACARSAGASPGREQDFREWLEARGYEVGARRPRMVRGLGLLARERSDQANATPGDTSFKTFSCNALGKSFDSGVTRCRTDTPPLTDAELERLFATEIEGARS